MKITIAKITFWISSSLLVLLLSVQVVTTDLYLLAHVDRYDSHRLVTWDHEFALREISAYLNGQRDDLEFPSTPGGTDVVMTERGLLHMIDVANLYSAGRGLAALFTVLAAIAGITLYDAKRLKETLRKQWIFPSAFAAFITLAMVIDFGAAFRLFHELFFSNDLWLLSPLDPLIIMLPSTFFFLTGATIIGIFVGVHGLIHLFAVKTKFEF